ncbi:hypothetical protein [Mycobacterium hubeiense]|uniref:hypothetical protein n=1 Tax=Mycobacterium hubeiense TaxID=1867256 RepID=UPI000C7F3B6C|nr:hypothetical protein [Mycobacterium sp. QGD 101]
MIDALRQLFNRVARWITGDGTGVVMVLRALLVGWVAGVVFRLLLVFWPLAIVVVAGAAVFYLVKRRRTVAHAQRQEEAALERYISAALTDDALRWAVHTWSKRDQR